MKRQADDKGKGEEILLAKLFLRVLEVPGSSAEVERSISAYNHIIKDKRLAMKPESIPKYVMIFANGAKRKEIGTKRRTYSTKKRRKKFNLNQSSFAPQAKNQ